MSLRRAAKIFVFFVCCAADTYVVRAMWTGRQIADGQIRRGYFERAGGDVTLAVDTLIREVFPSFLLTTDGELQVPPGVTAVVPLDPGVEYELACDSTLAPYVVIGVEAPLPPAAHTPTLPGEALLAENRALVLSEGRLALAGWNAALPWRNDAKRLSDLGRACGDGEERSTLRVQMTGSQLELRLGHCAVAEPRGATGTPLLAAIAGPDWIRITRRPGWTGTSWVIWPVLFAIVVKMAALWWSVGLVSAVALAALLLGASFIVPVAATLTWPITLAMGLVTAILRLVLIGLRHLRPAWRPAAIAVLVASVATVVALNVPETKPVSIPPIQHTHEERAEPDLCAVVGYSSAGGASLRGSTQQRGLRGIRSFLDRDCERCRDKTGALAGSGETLAWMKDAYCISPATFGTDGQVVFLGSANDDFFWGVTTMARMFIVNQQGIEAWRSSQGPATSASLARMDEQLSALDGFIRCVHERRARLLFLHDFLVTDLVAGREPDRAAMLSRRREAVEAAGGTFVDLFEVFGAEAGVSWFNDYVHPSLIGHEQFANLACRRFP